MATSGNYRFTLDVSDIIEEAFERIGDELRTGYDYRTARRSLDLMFLEWQNRGLNLWTVKEGTQALSSGTGKYTLDADELDIIEAMIRTDSGDTSSQADLSIERISISDWARQTNKLQSGKPVQYWIERTTDGINVQVWPVPDTSDYTLVYYYMSRIEDSGVPGSNTVDVPDRYLPCLVAGLAYHLAMKKADKMPMAPALKAEYEEQWQLASEAARDKASFFIKPGGY